MGEKQVIKGYYGGMCPGYASPKDKGSLYENSVKLKEKGV